MSNSKNVVPILLALILAITLAFPMNVTAATCEITFENARVTLEDGTEVYQPITITVDDVEHETPFTLTFDVCTEYDVKIYAVKYHEGNYYRHRTALFGPSTKFGWNYAGDVDIKLVNGHNGHLIFHFHCKGGTGTCTVTAKFARAGPRIDVMRMPVIKGPDAQLIAMQNEVVHFNEGLIRTGDIEKLDEAGFTITYDPGFHMGYIGFNIRDTDYIKSYWRPEITYWPLADVQVRHALIHCYDQESIVAAIYGYTCTPVQSMIPPSQGGWQYTQQRKHPYNPGSPFATTKYDPVTKEYEDSCSIMRYAEYKFVDAGTIGVVDAADYWKMPNGDPMPRLKLFTPTYETAPTSAEHGARFVADLGEIGLAATDANGYKGIEHEPSDFDWYMDEMVDYGKFDLFMVFLSLGRFPDHIYDMLHSSMDSVINPGMVNHPGVVDPEIDRLVTIVKISLNHTEKLAAAHEVQRLLYEPEECPVALPYMLLYSRIYFNAFNPNLRGIVKSPGYGSENGYTDANVYWEPGTEVLTPEGKTVIDFVSGEEPEIFNPAYASTVYTWYILDNILDGLMGVNPYTHEDLPGMAYDWEIQKWAMEEEVETLLDDTLDNVTDSHWHEDYPYWGMNWYLTSFTDNDASNTPTVGDQCMFDPDPFEYEIIDVTWDIKVENKSEPWNEMKLSGTGAANRPPIPIPGSPAGMLGSTWHEEYPTRSTIWTCTGFTDNGDGVLSRSDQIMFNGKWYHVDSVTVTIHLDKKPIDGEIDKVMQFVGSAQKVLFWLRKDVFWQDGNPYTAHDAKFNWLFLRDNKIPRYTGSWKFIKDVAVVSDYKVVVYLNVTSQFLLYDLAGLAALFPPPVWAPLDGKPLADILAYQPDQHTEKPADAGPWFGTDMGTKTQLYGTGQFVFDYYDKVNFVSEMHQNPGYYEITTDVEDQKVDMFHRCGDVNYDGVVWADDRGQMGVLFGTNKYLDPDKYDPDVDVNSDEWINIVDISLANYFFGDQREWP